MLHTDIEYDIATVGAPAHRARGAVQTSRRERRGQTIMMRRCEKEKVGHQHAYISEWKRYPTVPAPSRDQAIKEIDSKISVSCSYRESG